MRTQKKETVLAASDKTMFRAHKNILYTQTDTLMLTRLSLSKQFTSDFVDNNPALPCPCRKMCMQRQYWRVHEFFDF